MDVPSNGAVVCNCIWGAWQSTAVNLRTDNLATMDRFRVRTTLATVLTRASLLLSCPPSYAKSSLRPSPTAVSSSACRHQLAAAATPERISFSEWWRRLAIVKGEFVAYMKQPIYIDWWKLLIVFVSFFVAFFLGIVFGFLLIIDSILRRLVAIVMALAQRGKTVLVGLR